ncbi:hypothetical protein [Methyloceanibacter caenitepidi]|uniref:Uncharacterized protein n=1 Tax=Methyloceanibacter caenitepidi TaxID=1384459 RepID=A0A0A8K8L4_9HYPH|nr:hypothetical protein [Methyloceanibacter caenitepidi]BAQ18329.1 hypothetical protein GL4_2896 [Methyloceanibacter caenitepidi]
MLRAERNAILLKNNHAAKAGPVFRDAVLAARDAVGPDAIDDDLMVWTMRLVEERDGFRPRRA